MPKLNTPGCNCCGGGGSCSNCTGAITSIDLVMSGWSRAHGSCTDDSAKFNGTFSMAGGALGGGSCCGFGRSVFPVRHSDIWPGFVSGCFTSLTGSGFYVSVGDDCGQIPQPSFTSVPTDRLVRVTIYSLAQDTTFSKCLYWWHIFETTISGSGQLACDLAAHLPLTVNYVAYEHKYNDCGFGAFTSSSTEDYTPPASVTLQ